MDRVVECVPNFSEGRDKARIAAIVDAIASVEGVSVLDVDPGADTNRTVVTFVGAPDAAAEAAFRGARAAAAVIDMRAHRGAHPRIGAMDVCPFVPVRGVTMEDCAELARRVGRRVGEELGVPVYLYERAASRPERRNLADVRKGEYEGLAARLAEPEWRPDFGPARMDERVARTGASVVGARPFLIAFNVNLNTKDVELARRVGGAVREAGLPRFSEHGEPLKRSDGSFEWQEGRLRGVKAIGWYIEAYGCAQVSINITDMDAAPLHVVYEECRKEAERLGVLVTGSEVVGLVPERSLLEAGRYYLDRQGKSPSAPRRDLVAAAVLSLGLNACGPFDAEKKVIERRLPAKAPLASLTVAGLVEEVSRDSPAPGGGSVAALAGSLGAGLAAMVDALTAAKPRLRERRAEMASHGQKAHELRERLLEAVDRDAEAFDAVLAALRLPKGTEAERAARELAVARASAAAAEVPLATLRACREAAAEARFAVERGSPASITDAGVGALAALAGAEGAAMNVLVNLRGADPSAAAPTRAEVERLRREVREDAEAAVRRVFEELERPAR